ncbi:MAG: hypothetical protein PHW69_00310 [Elusimicrobiaceae bacterium]|nr:hypothetical protein [Elusimicrobiaceae bacterium]
MPLELADGEDHLPEFIELPYRLHKNTPWVPELKAETRALLSPGHPFAENGELKLFIALRDGVCAGRIAAVVNRLHNTFHNDRCGFFGFFECENNPETAGMLIGAVKEFLGTRGLGAMRGPMNPSTNHTCGMLCEGYDLPPVIMMPWNPSYYHELMASCGLEKVKDVVSFIRYTKQDMSPRLEKILARIDRKPNIKIRPFDISRLDKEMSLMREIYNDAWSENWGFIPLSRRDVEADAKSLKPILKGEHGTIVEVNGVPAGVGLVIPDINQALAKTRGSLTPLNLLPFLWQLKHITFSRLITLGVKKEYRMLGLDLLLVREAIRTAAKLGWDGGDLGWVLEDNVKMINIIEEVGGRLYKRFRIYQCPL